MDVQDRSLSHFWYCWPLWKHHWLPFHCHICDTWHCQFNKMGWHLVERVIDSVSAYATLTGRLWTTVLFLLRIVVITSIGYVMLFLRFYLLATFQRRDDKVKLVKLGVPWNWTTHFEIGYFRTVHFQTVQFQTVQFRVVLRQRCVSAYFSILKN